MKVYLPLTGSLTSLDPLEGDPLDPVRFASLEELGYSLLHGEEVTLTLVEVDVAGSRALVEVEGSARCLEFIEKRVVEPDMTALRGRLGLPALLYLGRPANEHPMERRAYEIQRQVKEATNGTAD